MIYCIQWLIYGIGTDECLILRIGGIMMQFLLTLLIPILLAFLVAFIIGKWQDKKTRDVVKFWNYIDKLNKK